MGLKDGGLRAGGLRNLTTSAATTVLEYNGGTFTNGDSTWVDEATRNGSQDMSLSGDPAESTLSDGASAVNFDGGDDYGLTTFPSELEGSSLQSFSVEFAFQTSTTNTFNYLSAVQNNSADQQILIAPNLNENFNEDQGNCAFRLEDDNDQRFQFAMDSGPDLTDGNRHDVSFIIDDSANNNATIIVDGAEQSVAIGTSEGPGSGFGSWDRDVATAALHDSSGSISNYLSVEIGAIRWHDTNISSQTIDSLP